MALWQAADSSGYSATSPLGIHNTICLAPADLQNKVDGQTGESLQQDKETGEYMQGNGQGMVHLGTSSHRSILSAYMPVCDTNPTHLETTKNNTAVASISSSIANTAISQCLALLNILHI